MGLAGWSERSNRAAAQGWPEEGTTIRCIDGSWMVRTAVVLSCFVDRYCWSIPAAVRGPPLPTRLTSPISSPLHKLPIALLLSTAERKRLRFFNRKTERLTLAAAYTKTEGVFSQKL